MSKGGFNCEFTFEPLECQMCHRYLRDPQTVNCCKQNFCKVCIKQVKEDHGNCPDCDRALTYQPYLKFNEVLLQFNVNCTYECGWSGPLKEHDKHLNIDPSDQTWLEGCPRFKVQCIYCKEERKQRQQYVQCLERKFQPSKLTCVYDITCTDELCTKWEVIGKELSLQRKKLQAIKILNGKDDQKDFYREMLKQWIESTNLPNWRKLLSAIRKSTLKKLAGNIEQGLLCDLRSEQQVTQLIKEAEDLKQEYKTQQAQFHQLARIKDRMQKCQKALQDKTGDLKFEENVKLLEEGLEKNQRKPYGSQGSSFALALATGHELVKEVLSFFKSEDQRKRESIIANYDKLINRCYYMIAEIRSLIGE